MSNPSNLYAEKIYAEHPMAFWALDDKADYISLITDLQRDLSDVDYWEEPDNGSAEQYYIPDNSPFPESPITKITGDLTDDEFGQIVCVSKDISNFTLLNKDLSTFSIGAFIKSLSVYVYSFEIGYEYYDTVSSSTIQRLKTYISSVQDKWVFVSETFDTPEENTTFRIVIKINYIAQGNNTEDYEFLINGVSAGQWSEEFNASSLGVVGEFIPNDISIEPSYGIKASAYGRQDKKGYYLVSNKSLMAKNTGIPLVYGASGLTKLTPNSNSYGMTYDVSSYGTSSYIFAGSQNPTITVTRGSTYTFQVNAPGHPFSIQEVSGAYNSQNQYNSGVSNNGAAVGNIVWVVPEDAPDSIYYVCRNHPIMNGKINVVDPAQKPSLIIPGQGFMGADGQYKEYTLEAWLRINSDSITKKRIVGPLGSDDGLYVEGPYLILKVGANYGSYYVGEWTRPMLVHIRVSQDNSSLLVNGEEVVSLNYLTDELYFPYSLDLDNRNQDWIGFYAYEDVSPIEVDCVALYTYKVPIVLAKKRFVYGQGVEFPEGINQAYSGSSIYIDYPFANYANNYSYPSIGNWSQATVDNLKTDSNLLSTPDYKLPEIVLGGATVDNLYSSLIENEEDLFFSFEDYQGSYMYFESLNFLKEKVKSFYGSFKLTSVNTEKQVLFKAESKTSSSYFEISCTGSYVIYTLNYNGIEETLLTLSPIDIEDMFSVGVDIDTMSKYFGGNVASFFGNSSSLSLYVAGSSNITETFSGKFYKIGFCTSRNHKEIAPFFNEKGIVIENDRVFREYLNTPDVEYNSTADYFGNNSAEWDLVIDGGLPVLATANTLQSHTASYTLSSSINFGSSYLDIDVQGYWEDYLPLTYFAKYITDNKSKPYYDLDFIQFNINYPAPSVFLEEEQFGSWTYKELYDVYNVPVQREYSSLDNQLFTGYLDYTDLRDRAYRNYKYDTSNSLVKSYITFQYIQNGANLSSDNFINTERPSNDSFVVPGESWRNTKYEVIDNMVIYTPKDVSNLDLAIVTHLEFNVKGILKNKVAIRTLEYSSQAFNNTSPNPIGTRFGHSLFPYKKAGLYYDYKTENPFTIYKGTSPYLYLTRYTGVEVKGTMDPKVNRGLSVSVNKEKSDNFKVMALQMAVRYDKDAFSYGAIEVFEIKARDRHIKFYLSAIHPQGHRAKIYAIDANTGRLENGIKFYLNGKLVKDPVLTVKEWAFLGVSFPKVLDFKNRIGLINLNGPLMFNTISYYESSNLQEGQEDELRRWFGVKYVLPETLEWDYWLTGEFMWQGTLVLSSTNYYGVDPSTIYKSYTGTNKIIIDTDSRLVIDNARSETEYEYRIYSGIKSKLITSSAI